MSRILWDHVESHYRAQCHSGVILTVDNDAMIKALKNAGNIVFDTEWWVETLSTVLEHWGLRSKRWTDPTTQMPRVHYRLTNERIPTGATGPIDGTGPLKGTGPLTNRLITGNLTTGSLDSGRLNSGRLNSGKLRDEDK